MPRQIIVVPAHGTGTIPSDERFVMGLNDTPWQSLRARRCRWTQPMRRAVAVRPVVGEVACQ